MNDAARFALCALLVAQPLLAEGPLRAGVAAHVATLETAEARQLLRDAVTEAELWRLRDLSVPLLYQRQYDTVVSVSVRYEGTDVLIDFLPRGSGAPEGRTQGTFTVRRSRQGGEVRSFRVLTRDEPSCYLEVRPFADRSLLDVFLLDPQEPLYHEIIVPARFDELLQSSLERLVRLTAAKVDWELVFFQGTRGEDERVGSLAKSIEAYLPGLGDAEDGAIDADGRFVYISTLQEQPPPGGLNCSGFVKWVVDGYYHPLRGLNSSVVEAKQKVARARGNSLAEALEERDPYFGLDWNRNLAVLLDGARGGTRGAGDPRAFDITAGARVPYVPEVGFPVSELPILLYRLAAGSPGNLYLGSVCDVTDPGEGLIRHFHTLVLLPYFDSRGRFVVEMFERGSKTDLASLFSRYAGAYVHLVRVPVTGTFAPLRLP